MNHKPGRQHQLFGRLSTIAAFCLLAGVTSAGVTFALFDRKFVRRTVVAPSTTGNTFIVTDFPSCDCNTPALARVFQGSGTPAVSVSTPTTTRDGYFSFTYRVTVMPGETITLMHFEVQRGASDTAGAHTQAQALVDLTDPNVLTGMSDIERAQVVNFVIPR